MVFKFVGVSQGWKLKNKLLPIHWIFVSAMLLVSSAANTEQVKIKPLFDTLAGEPVVNLGTDGLLTQIPVEDPLLVSLGRNQYHRHCAVCHGDQLQGQPNPDVRLESGLLPAPAHNETGHTWHHADDQLFEIVKYGAVVAMQDPDYRSAMPAFEALLTDEDILAVLVFIRSTWPAKLKEWQSGANDAQTGRRWWLESDK